MQTGNASPSPNLGERQRPAVAPANPLLTAAILPTLLRLSAPNILALSVQSLVVIAETGYIGFIGVEALAAMALVFPFIMLTQMMSSGAMGGGVSSAISRALGAGDGARARKLALHAIGIGSGAGIFFTVIFLAFGPSLYVLLGGRGTVLQQAVAYSTAFFCASFTIWLNNTLMSIVRGTGNMRLSSATMICVGIIQIVLGGALSLGLGPFPRLGIVGVAFGQTFAALLGALFLIWYLAKGPSRLRIGMKGVSLDAELCRDILRVGAVACLSPMQSILVVVILARLAAHFGTAELAGFGIGVRLELLLVPIAFAIGVACVPMVGMAMGAGDISRARKVAWSGAALSGALIGAIGIIFALWPMLWAGIFAAPGPVRDAADDYLMIAGAGFPAYGIGLCLYFASQGSGKIVGPVLAGTVRLAVVLAGGWWLLGTNKPFQYLAILVAVAMLAYGVSAVLFVWVTRWGPPARAR